MNNNFYLSKYIVYICMPNKNHKLNHIFADQCKTKINLVNTKLINKYYMEVGILIYVSVVFILHIGTLIISISTRTHCNLIH